MMNGDGKPFLTLAEAASKLPAELCATADSLRETPPTGLIVTHCGPNGDKAVHVDDLGDFLQKYVAGASIDPPSSFSTPKRRLRCEPRRGA
jgi:hypothetical protein